MTQTIKKTTANSRVQVLDTAFYIPQLNRHRRIWVCLPRDYHHTHLYYPVLYLQDGQNIFDAATAFAGEWGVDEALDTLGPRFGESIIVAVDNGGDKRLSEYSPFDFTLGQGNKQLAVKAEGDAFAAFLVNTLQPYLEKCFRISPNPRHHFIAGSSMGALISYHAVLQYPGKWGGAGIFSPAFWVVRDPLLAATRQKAASLQVPLYFYAGGKEGDEMLTDMQAVQTALIHAGAPQHVSVIWPDGQHNEATWRKAFPAFYEWMMQRISEGR